MPTSSREFQRAARQRLSTAEFLLRHTYALDAVYLSGYVIECSLKALILDHAQQQEQTELLKKITSGSRGHDREMLGGILRERGTQIPLDIIRRFRRFPWTTSLRYETGRKPMGEARGYLATAKQVYDWVQGELS